MAKETDKKAYSIFDTCTLSGIQQVYLDHS